MPPSDARCRAKSSQGRWTFNAESAHNAAGALAIDDAVIAGRLGRSVVPAVADLIEVAAAVQFVDRMERRPLAMHGGDSWARQISLTIGVREPDRWRADSVDRQLRELLAWLTDDEWDIEFTRRSAPSRPSESLLFLFETQPQGSAVALYSGGLDSFAGLALDVASGIEPVLVSVVANRRQGARQSQTVLALQQRLGIPLQRVAVNSHLHQTKAQESTQRSRGFGFLSIASSVAVTADISTIRVYENGIGAINLPYSHAQIGAQATRSMHPQSLRLAAALFSVVLDRPLSIVNASQDRTKADMCRQLPIELHPVVPQAMSCDTAFSHRASPIASCGRCMSCLLRRQALWAAGMGTLDQRTQYRTDVLRVGMSDSEEADELKAMLSQAARIDVALSDDEPWQSMLMEFPELIDTIEAIAGESSATAVSDQLVGMFGRYVNEWSSFPAPIVRAFLPHPREAAA